MELKQKVVAFGVMCGFPLAASVETQERFDTAYPFIFYFFHGIFISLSLGVLVRAYRRGAITRSLLIGGARSWHCCIF